MIVKRDALERWAEVLAEIVEVPPAPGYSIIFEPAGLVGRRTLTRYFVNGSIDGVRSRLSLRSACKKLRECASPNSTTWVYS